VPDDPGGDAVGPGGDELDERNDAIADRVEMLSYFLGQHAGGLELEDIAEDGRVTVRYTGMCTGCLYRPVTMAATIRPALLEITGVTGVEAVGSRLNDEASRKLEEDLGRWWLPVVGRRSTPSETADADETDDAG
jgi:Fe-S cluster biogenesis protein NfuA